LHDAVERAETGAAALRAVITETICSFATQMDDFRLTFLHAQVARPGSVKVTAEQLARLRPLNDLSYAGTASRLAGDCQRARGRARVEPRLLAFLAQAAAIGVLTFKGMVESADDPLLYTDQQLIDALCRIFEAAATP
jgi:hypothetical protein